MKNFIIILFFLLFGCGNPTPKVTPDKLPDGVVNYPYSEVIQISNGALNRKSIEVVITPDDSGLEWKPKVLYQTTYGGEVEKHEDFHYITIYGTPTKKGIITISVFGGTLGTMYPGKAFGKVYKINVK